MLSYGGVIVRDAVAAAADWFISDWADLEAALKRYKVRNQPGILSMLVVQDSCTSQLPFLLFTSNRATIEPVYCLMPMHVGH